MSEADPTDTRRSVSEADPTDTRPSVSGGGEPVVVVRDRSQRGASSGPLGSVGVLKREHHTMVGTQPDDWIGDGVGDAASRERGEFLAGEGEGNPGARDACWTADGYERKGLAGLELKLPFAANNPHFVFTDRSRDLGCGELGRSENGEVGELVVEASVAAHDNSDVGCTSR